MNLRDFYKEHYLLEVNRRQELTNSIALPVGVLSVLVSAILMLAKEIDYPLDKIEYFQLVMILISLFFCGLSLFFLIRSYFGYKYEYIATPKEIKKYFDDLIAHYIGIGLSPVDARKQAEDETLEQIDSQYAERTHKNTVNNDTKSYYLHKANNALIYSIISTIITGLPYVTNSIISPSETYKVELVNLKELKMSNQSTSPPDQPASTPQPTRQQQEPRQVAPPKPNFPSERIILEDTRPITKMDTDK